VNCIETYERVATACGEPLAVALENLSLDSGMTVNHSVWSKWRSGKRTPPPEVLRIINRTIACYVLRQNGFDALHEDDVLQGVADAFSPPVRQREPGSTAPQ
tara:strand:- start:61969 stop:62274 length:306 start_codon:yes stop_codon:yes gene_type:complete